MPLFFADPAKCTRDGICVAECPVRIIELATGDSAPHVPAAAEDFCRSCGHCIAVCPREAVTCGGVAADQLPPVDPRLLPPAAEVAHFLRARRSIRSYTPRRVDRENLTALIEVARFAPSGSNRQPVHWLVVHSPDEVRRLAGMVVDWMRAGLPALSGAAQRNTERVLALWDAGSEVICRGAPHLVVASAAPEPPSTSTDCVIALTYLELAAAALGVGACWAGYFMAAVRQWAPLQHALDVPPGHVVGGAMMLGYARYDYPRMPLRNEARITWQGEDQG